MAHPGNIKDFLFAVWEGGGNVPPTLAVARQLLERGHRVRWLGEVCQRSEAELAGIEFIAWREAPCRSDRSVHSEYLRDFDANDTPGQFALTRDRLMIGPVARYARDALNEIGRRATDLLVSSEMLFGAMLAAEASRTPLALLAANLSLVPLPGVPPLGSGLVPADSRDELQRECEAAKQARALLNVGLPALNSARRAFGLAPLRDVLEQAQVARRLLLMTSRTFDFPARALPTFVRYVGPQLADPPWCGDWRSPWSREDSRPLVLVAFSTTFQNQAPVLARVITALQTLRVRVVVTLGPAIADVSLDRLDDVQVVTNAPHSKILKESYAVVTHGGHGTVMRALAADVPLLLMPMGRDQWDNAVRVTTRGAGIQMLPEASASEISREIQRLLGDADYKRSAAILGAAIRREAQESRVILELESAAVG